MNSNRFVPSWKESLGWIFLPNPIGVVSCDTLRILPKLFSKKVCLGMSPRINNFEGKS